MNKMHLDLSSPIQSLFTFYSSTDSYSIIIVDSHDPSRLTLSGVIAFYSILNIDAEHVYANNSNDL